MSQTFYSQWNKVLESVREEIGPTSYDIWFSMVNYNKFQDGNLYIDVPNSLTKEWIESRYLSLLQKKMENLINTNIKIILTTEPIQEKKNNIVGYLNPKYTFDTFVIGNSNHFAHAACYAVSESPSRAYNPLFIYGGVGLGKTHLMHGIGHHIIEKYPTLSVTYVSSEQFTNELISSIRDDNTSGFRNKYRNIDVLLIDDIQFLAGKERTQEEFFHTFNTLYEANKQLVISSDRPPKDIPTLEDRLRSRFEWGLITDIGPPDLETRIAILRKKAEVDNLNISYDVLDYIANYIYSNIRELEGALIRLVAYATITNKPIDINTASEALKDILPPPRPKKITIDIIQSIVAKHYGIDIKELNSKKRNRNLVLPRQIAMFLARKLTDLSYPQIGSMFGGRDHTTVLHAYDKIEKDLVIKNDLAETIDQLYKEIDPNYIKQ